MKARYVMIGGFLGAGKSTSVAHLAQRFTDRGLRVGLITNDQGSNLVDTRTLRRQGFAVEEIAGGCFCCRFDSLSTAARRLDAESRPDVFLAEPVGSCTDLVATVSYPLRRLYGDEFTIAPLSVVLDPVRASRILGLREGRRFSDKVRYVYLKQLEEAELLVINKIDLLADTERHRLRRELAERYPQARVLEVSARQELGMEPWFELLASSETTERATMDVDYETYGEGEALLGWLNATLRLASPSELDGNAWLADLAGSLRDRLQAADAEVAHLKMTLSPEGGINELGRVHLVNLDFVPETAERLRDPVRAGQLIVNLRAEASPETLRGCLEAELASRAKPCAAADERLELEHLECFQPGQPIPTHRLSVGS
ncbi:MAG: GTP-binding protein [Acidobacteriota bacterium]